MVQVHWAALQQIKAAFRIVSAFDVLGRSKQAFHLLCECVEFQDLARGQTGFLHRLDCDGFANERGPISVRVPYQLCRLGANLSCDDLGLLIDEKVIHTPPSPGQRLLPLRSPLR